MKGKIRRKNNANYHMLNLLLNMHFNISGRVVEQACFPGKSENNLLKDDKEMD